MKDAKEIAALFRKAGLQTKEQMFAYARNELGLGESIDFFNAYMKRNGGNNSPGSKWESMDAWESQGHAVSSAVATLCSARARTQSASIAPKNEKAQPKSLPPKSVTDLYEQWCRKNDHVTNDVELAHFAGVTGPALYHARKKLIDQGWEFERTESGWEVIARPRPPKPEKTYTESEVKTMMAELLNKFGK